MIFAQTVRSATLLLVLLNPFLLTVYLIGLVRRLTMREFATAVGRAAIFSGVVFCIFAWVGDFIFRDIFQVRFAAFLIFGGIVFVVVALRFMFHGPSAIESLRGEGKEAAGSIAMPFMIGAGTINASVLAGSRQSVFGAFLAIGLALAVTVAIVITMKSVHDFVSGRNEELVARYVDLCGRISALIIGAMAVEMIFQGLEQWWRLVIVGGPG